ncbi:unnamed protein product [Closterium sp. NIES-65]|nr:unnamed protein product [Closterium sp. NIES-65]
MASPPVLAFDAEGRPVKFDTWLDDLYLYLQLTAKDDISLYDHALGHVTAPAATADSTARSQWQTRDAHARFAIRNSLPIDEREHCGQHKTAQALYTAVIARYSSPASATLGRLSLPYLFPDLASFHTVADLITHLRTSEARFRAAMPAEFLATHPPPLWLTLYHLVTRLPDTLRSVRDHFLARCPTELTINLLEKELLAAEARIVAVGASRGDPRTPFFEGCSPSPFFPLSPLLLLSTSLVLRRSGLRLLRVGAVAARAKRARAAAVTAGEAVVGEVAVVGVVAAAAGEVAGAEAVVGVAVDAGGGRGWVVEEVLALSATPGAGEAAALGACASAPPGTESTAALHTFTLDSGASRCFFRDRTALEPLARPVAVSLADPSGGPVIATSSTVLPCPAVPSGTLSGLHLPSFSTNLVAGCALQDGGVHQFTPAYERGPPSPPTLPCSSLTSLCRGAAARRSSLLLVSPDDCSLADAPHGRVGPARVRGQGQERYFLIVVDDYSRYTTVFPLRTKGEVPDVLIPWIRRARLQLSERFHSDFPVLRLHSDRDGEFPLTSWKPTVLSTALSSLSGFRPLHSRMGLRSAALAWSWRSPIPP